MKKLLFIFLILFTYSYSQENRIVRQQELSDSLDAVRTLIGTGGVPLPDSVLYESEVRVSYPDANTIEIKYGEVISLDPSTLEVIDGVLTSIGGVSSLPDSIVYASELNPYASKTATQTFTGLNTFSGNKTVFGTTTNDSVSIRGDLIIDGRFYIIGGTGDINEDGGIYGDDYNLMVNYIVNGNMLTKQQWMTADMNGDGNVDWRDVTILQYVQGEEIPFGATYLTKKQNGIRAANNIMGASSFDDFIVKGSLTIIDSLYLGDLIFPASDGIGGQVLKTDGNGNLYFDNDATGSGGSAYADSLVKDGVTVSGNDFALENQIPDSVLKVSGSSYKLSYTGIDINRWLGSLQNTTTGVIRLGKTYNDKRLNIGSYTDVWNIDYVIPPYNLSADWLYSIEHRTDYFNDTLNTVAHSDIVNIDGTGTPIWKTNDVRIMGNEIAVNVGDLPDSVALNWSLAGLSGNKVILSEANKTAVESRFPMPVRGFEFKFGSTPNYIFPRVYSFFSDLTTNTPSLETAYHFYGQGNYPSYFGGNILTDGYLRVQDSIIIGTSTVKIYPDSVLVGGVRLAKITEAGGLDTSVVNALIEANEDSSGQSIIGTTATLDSIITDYWNDALGGSTIDTAIVNALIEANEDTTGSAIIGTTATLDSIITAFWNGSLGSGSTWDSTYAYQRIIALENNVSALQDTIAYFTNAITSILTALDTCGCGAVIVDNTPPLPPASYVAIGGTSETQYVTTWTDPVASDLDSIRWYEGSSADTSAMNWIASIVAGTETYTRTGRTSGTTYWSAVKAIDDSGNVSYFSNIDSATTQSAGGVIPDAKLDFETGDLSEWSSTSGANLSASTTVAHGGTYSMRVGTNSYGIYNFTSDTEVWLTFWVYLPSTSSQNATTNYMAMFDNGIADRTCVGTNNSPWSEWIVGVNSGNLTDDDFTTNFSANTWHKVKIYYQTNGTTTSQHQVWIDDTSIWSDTDIYTGSVQNFTVGSEAATITNYFYIDDIKLYTSDPGTQD